MHFLGIIPARYASTRFPGKPLADLGGKPMIQRVYERVRPTVDELWVATDDERIRQAVEAFGGDVVMTSDTHRSGTDRRIEPLAQPLLTAYVEVGEIRNPHILKGASHLFHCGGNLLQVGRLFVRGRDDDTDVLTHTVRRKEAALDPYDLPIVPLHNETRLCRHEGDLRRLKILRIRMAQERGDIRR